MTAIGALNQRHVIQVVHSLIPGGSERLACDLALRLDRSRVRSSICALTQGGPLAEALENAAIPFYIAGCAPGRQWRVIPQLYRLFREARVDIVQTHHIKQLLYSAVGARLAGAAVVHVEHEYYTLQPLGVQRRLRAAASLCHRIVAIGDEVKAFLVNEVGVPPAKLAVIPNGVDVERYVPRPRVTREALGLRPSDRLIGHVARLEPEKDQVTLLRAFRVVVDTHPNARLVIIGDGSRRDELEYLAGALGIGARVDFLGLRQDVANILPHLEVFVLSSLMEGLPIAMLEAMASARPVVATALGEIPRVIQNGITGLTVPSADPVALAHAVTTVLDRPELGRTMGAAGRRLVEGRFSLARMVGQYEVLYDSLGSAIGHRPTIVDGAMRRGTW